jgi:hypothetical protein
MITRMTEILGPTLQPRLYHLTHHYLNMISWSCSCYLGINFSLSSRRPRAVNGRKVEKCCLLLVMLHDSPIKSLQIKRRVFSHYPNFEVKCSLSPSVTRKTIDPAENTFTMAFLSLSQALTHSLTTRAVNRTYHIPAIHFVLYPTCQYRLARQVLAD